MNAHASVPASALLAKATTYSRVNLSVGNGPFVVCNKLSCASLRLIEAAYKAVAQDVNKPEYVLIRVLGLASLVIDLVLMLKILDNPKELTFSEGGPTDDSLASA